MEGIKKSWNYGLRKVKKTDEPPSEPEPDEPEQPKLTLREHMFRRMELNEIFLFIVLIILIAIFVFIFFNPIDNPLKEKDRYTNL